MAKKAWGPGAWAAEAEQAEEERRNMEAGGGEAESFPSLGEAAARVAKQKKKSKGQTLTYSELMTGVYVGPGGRNRAAPTDSAAAAAAGLTVDERLKLPTRPRERSEEEEFAPGRLGGGFRDYGRSREVAPPGRSFGGESGGGGGDWGSSRRRSYGGGGGLGFEEENERSFELAPSRADVADSWAATKKSLPPPRVDVAPLPPAASRADEVDSWKRAVPAPSTPERRYGYGTEGERWGGGGGGGGRERNWGFNRPRVDSPAPPPLQVVAEGPPKPKINPFGAARPREEVLAEKGHDWRRLDLELELKSSSSRPTSAQSSRPGSRPGSGQSSRSRPQSPGLNSLAVGDEIGGSGGARVAVAVAVAVARPKVNPFGDAKPREEVLQERGKDWKKIDFELEHRSVERPETEEERNLKEEIYALKKLAEETVTDEAHGNGLALREHTTEEKRPTLKEEITLKEKKLELLIRELDDKVRFGKKGGDSRPGSASGRSFEHSGRPMSQSGLSEGGRRYDSFERPRSRGGEDRVAVVRTRPSEEKRGMYMERSFSNRSRLSSEERW